MKILTGKIVWLSPQIIPVSNSENSKKSNVKKETEIPESKGPSYTNINVNTGSRVFCYFLNTKMFYNLGHIKKGSTILHSFFVVKKENFLV